MPRKLNGLLAVLVVIMIIGMVVLLCSRPRFTAEATVAHGMTTRKEQRVPDTMVSCSSVVEVGIPGKWQPVNNKSYVAGGYRAELPDMPTSIYAAVAGDFTQECNERRTSYLGYAALLTVPACLIGAAVIARRPESV